MMKKDADSSPWHSEDAKKAPNPKFEARNKFKIIIERKGIKCSKQEELDLAFWIFSAFRSD
jgi:hypothetical protein